MARTLHPLLLVAIALSATDVAGQTWRGLVVAPEQRCSPYRSDDYSYPQSVEASIVRELGGIYSPYTGERFASTRQTDIEHMVARSEAHDSGSLPGHTRDSPRVRPRPVEPDARQPGIESRGQGRA